MEPCCIVLATFTGPKVISWARQLRPIQVGHPPPASALRNRLAADRPRRRHLCDVGSVLIRKSASFY